MDENGKFGLKNDELRPVDPPAAEAPVAAANDSEDYVETAEERAARIAEEKKLPKMQLWERKLLDFSLRNNLLNLRVKGKVVGIVSAAIAKVEDALQAKKEFAVVAWEGKKVEPADETGMRASETIGEDGQKTVTEALEKGKLFAYQSAAELVTAMKGLYRAARTALEENGANTLYLTLGALKWFEDAKSQKPRYAPILLLPVEIVKKSGNNYVVRMRDEDIIMNTTLVELMRQQYEVDLSALDALPMDDSGVDVAAVMQTVGQAISAQPRWQVVEESVLGLFSFSKFVMWNDIHTNGQKMRENPIIESLISNQMKLDVRSEGVDAAQADWQHEPKDFATPVDADSSQLEAVIESGEGKSFILHGPPGTGKSQTITNMIANALWQGKRVLFVAEKMAALSVVQKRLKKIGIDTFCLEMHSNKATKQHFLAQMEAALEVQHGGNAEEFERKSAELFQQRKRLLEYMQALHQRNNSGYSPYEMMEQFLSVDGDEMTPSDALWQNMTKERMAQIESELQDVDGVLRSTGHPSQHPLLGLCVADSSITAGERLRTALQQVQQPLARLVLQQPNATLEQLVQYETLQREVDGKWFLPKIFAKRKMKKTLQESGNHVAWNDDAAAVAAFAKQYGVSGLSLADLSGKLDTWTANTDKAHDWSLWCLKQQALEQDGLGEAVNFLITSGKNGAQTAGALRKGVMRKMAMRSIDANPLLSQFNGQVIEEKIETYRQLAKDFQSVTKQALYARLASRTPNVTMEASNNSEMSILKRAIKSKGRGKTIRQLFDSIPTLLPRLCPCMLMSPLSVAQYIDLNNEKFDLVMFDEASQMPTSEAVGAIARGKALIVVGDPMQMPPTSFFQTTNVGEEDMEIDDMESILDDCLALSVPSRYLAWHYRSKHESLIAFSNANYYGGRLYTFPSVDDRASKVTFVPVDGVYDMGKTRCNRVEAEAIVKEVIRRLSDPELSKRSIGIVSFSKVQQDLIEDLLVKELAEHPELEKLAYDGEEPIFVKNLENVQGDERDVILFSVGYGPDKDGKVSMNFGPLNTTGGERRLNVAVSRSCYEMMIFSSLRPEQIDLKRTNAEGVKGLKAFLEFAKSGRNATIEQQASASTDDTAATVDAIAAELRAKGFEVDTHVGRSNFKIDLAVINPEDNQQYLLAILCDGKNYFETKTERDREIGQPGVLKMLGWNIMRVWTVDWFINREQVMQRILQNIDYIQHPEHKPKTNPTTAAPTAPVNPVPKPMAEEKPATTTVAAPKTTKKPVVSEGTLQRPYQVAALRKTQKKYSIDDVRNNIDSLAKRVAAVIEAEQPITLNLLAKRVAESLQMRSTDALKALILDNYAPAVIDKSQPDASNPFFWTDAEEKNNYHTFRTESGRSIEDIPIVEVENAVLYAVEQQVAIPVADLTHLTQQLLGLSRTNEAIEKTIRDKVIARLWRGQNPKLDIDPKTQVVKLKNA